ncbi:MAG: hypothetical protein MI861_04765, partial [Pirellulales bacterium]|nr:hypothetical protein [Pirellulales bacterium]
EGIKCAAVNSAPQGDSSKSVKLQLTADQGTTFQGPIRIVGRPSGDPQQDPAAPVPAHQASIPAHHVINNLFPIHDVWLSVSP